MKRTKIVCTLGPASERPDILERMVRAGLNVARLNLSHGDRATHAARLQAVRAVSARLNTPVGVLFDLQGPKIRLGELPGSSVTMREGDLVTLHSGLNSPVGAFPVDYEGLSSDLRAGSTVMLRDGIVALEVVGIDGPFVRCAVRRGGEVSSRQGVTLPGAAVNLPPLTEKDRSDLLFAVEMGADFVALSFARRAAHVQELKELLARAGAPAMPVIAKIENREGVERCDEIIAAADGVMVARGDLGVEMPAEEVPLVQKDLIRRCNLAGKTVITATEMLESMIRNPRPTRAEVGDVANAIIDGSDAVMLSAETAVGQYPIEAVEFMSRVAQFTEGSLDYEGILMNKQVGATRTISDAISHATCQTALDLNAAVIITSTQSGSTACMVSKYRPRAPIVATTPSAEVARRMTLVWGVRPVVVPRTSTIDELLDVSIAGVIQEGLASPGQLVVISAGVRSHRPGSTNLLQVHRISAEGRAEQTIDSQGLT